MHASSMSSVSCCMAAQQLAGMRLRCTESASLSQGQPALCIAPKEIPFSPSKRRDCFAGTASPPQLRCATIMHSHAK